MYTCLFAGHKLIGIVHHHVHMEIMTSKKSSKPATEVNPREASQFKPTSVIAKERGVVCDKTLTLRLPAELKEKLKELPNWQDEVRQALAVLVGF